MLFFVVDGKRIPTSISPFLLIDETTNKPTQVPAYLNSFWYTGFSQVGGKTLQDKINNENTIINSVDTNHSITFDTIMHGSPAIYQRMTAPATNCVKMSGTGPKKIVFVRSSSWNGTVDDFLFQANATRDRFLATDPFKSYASEFSFSAELKQDSFSCGTKGVYEVVIMASNPSNPLIGVSSPKNSIINIVSVNVAKADLSNISSANSIPHAVLRETGRITAGLQEEQYVTGTSGTLSSPLTTCTTDPFKDFRDSATNYIYGAIDQTGCAYEKDRLSGRQYLRPAVKSIMNSVPPAQVANPPADSEKFDIISCGYLISSIKGEALTKENALKNWTECWKMDVAKGGVPPLVSAPKINKIEAGLPDIGGVGQVTRGGKIIIYGIGFTSVGNSVQYVNDADKKIYEINNLPLENVEPEGSSITFVLPTDTPTGQYSLKVGALNSSWGIEHPLIVHGAAPSDLIAVADKKGQISLSWKDNSDDERGFDINYREFDSEYTSFYYSGMVEENITSFIKKGLLPSAKYQYKVVAKFRDDFDSLYARSNIVTVTTLPKPNPPKVSARALSDSAIEISWSVDTDIAEYEIAEVIDKERFYGLLVVINNSEYEAIGKGYIKWLDKIPVNGNEKELGSFQLGLDPSTEHCYVVRAVVNNSPNMSDMSDIRCATTLEEGGVLSLAGEGSESSISGTAVFNFDPSDSSNISSIQLVADNGTVIATDKSDPYAFSFDSTDLTNGSHSIYAVINTFPNIPGDSGNIIKTKPITIVINNPSNGIPPPTTIKLSSISPNNISSNCRESGCDVITLTGTGFDLANNTVHFKSRSTGIDTEVNSVSTIEATRLALSIPSLSDGVYDVSVEDAVGNISNSLTLTLGLIPISETSNTIIANIISPGQKLTLSVLDPSTLTESNIVTVRNDRGVIVQSVTPTVNAVTGRINFTFNPSDSTGEFFTVLLNNSDQVAISHQRSATACPDGTHSDPDFPNDDTKCIPDGTPSQNPTGNGGILTQIVPCSGIEAKDGLPACDFNMLMVLARNIINFLLVFSTAIAAACFFFAGYLYLTAGGNVGQVTRAHSIFKNVAVGLIIALSAWLIVYTVLTTLIPDDQQLKNYNLLNNA